LIYIPAAACTTSSSSAIPLKEGDIPALIIECDNDDVHGVVIFSHSNGSDLGSMIEGVKAYAAKWSVHIVICW
jgi:hypothetical protein